MRYSQRRSRSAKVWRKAFRTLPWATADVRSVPCSRMSSSIARPMTTAGMPNRIDVPRQPKLAIVHAPMRMTTTVPTLPPAMWALIAKPRRSGGNCSARRPFPTGCCGAAPIRDRTFGIANVPKLVASAWAANPPPKRRPPVPSRTLRDMTRVSDANESWTMPETIAPNEAR